MRGAERENDRQLEDVRLAPKKKTMSAIYTQDEYGRPVIILREQEKKSRLRGIEAHKVFQFHVRRRAIKSGCVAPDHPCLAVPWSVPRHARNSTTNFH